MSFVFQLNLDAVWTVIFGVPASKPVSIATRDDFCQDAAVVLLAMIRFMLNQVCWHLFYVLHFEAL